MYNHLNNGKDTVTDEVKKGFLHTPLYPVAPSHVPRKQ